MDKVKLINDAVQSVDSRYRLSVILFKRAKFINQGDEPLVKPKFVKPHLVALQEFCEGYIEWKAPDGEWVQVKQR